MSVPVVLLGYQQKWLADASPVRVAEKSRRIGLSWSQAAESALLASAEHGMDSWYIGYNKEMAQEFIRDVGFWAKNYNLVASEVDEIVLEDEEKDIIAYKVTFASEFRVTALSSRPSNLRGKQGLVIIDEAAFHDNLDELIKAAMALLIWGGRVCIISTHNGEDNPFNELIKEIRSGKLDYSLHKTTFDDALCQGLYKRICLRMGIEWTADKENEWRERIINLYRDNADEELFCIPQKGSGLYFSNVLLDSVSQPGIPILKLAFKDSFTTEPEELREEICDDWLREHVEPLLNVINDQAKENPGIKSYYGFDFGRTGDLSVFVPFLVLNRLRRPPFILELRNVPFTQQRQILFYCVSRLPHFMHGANDARGNGQYLAEVALQKFGAGRITQVMLSEKWYSENMPKYKAGMEDKEVIIPQDADIKADHRLVKVNKGIPKIASDTRTKGSNGEQRHGDSAIAFALAWFASLQSSMIIEFESTGARDFNRNSMLDYLGD